MITYYYKHFQRDPKVARTIDEEEWKVLKVSLDRDADRNLLLYAIAVNSNGELLYCRGEAIVVEAMQRLASLMKKG